MFYIIECFLPLLDGHGIKDHIISPSWTLIFPWTRQGNIGCPGRWICLEDTRETKGKEGKQTTKSIPCQKPTRLLTFLMAWIVKASFNKKLMFYFSSQGNLFCFATCFVCFFVAVREETSSVMEPSARGTAWDRLNLGLY